MTVRPPRSNGGSMSTAEITSRIEAMFADDRRPVGPTVAR
ncbi:hypothetical protein M2275_002910 [Rhodococcus opacus]|nr:hypothetical protein [Rhodococcus opacus]